MNFNIAEFEFAAGNISQMPESDLPEVVFSGKSNVGKSSLINKLLNRKALARVSATPGKTATINSYKLKECRLMDLPGYGYAKVSQTEKAKWGKLMESYFNSERDIRLVVQILDIRHKPTADDYGMINFMIEREIPFIIACTKKDKLNKTQFANQMEMFNQLFEEHEIKFLPFSSTKGDGVDELKEIITEIATA
ncbi:MAG: ribosome biogenesis GTP-binding protein YihA/YsxC [Clostridia bacterium]